jgi:hypothetical protein
MSSHPNSTCASLAHIEGLKINGNIGRGDVGPFLFIAAIWPLPGRSHPDPFQTLATQLLHARLSRSRLRVIDIRWQFTFPYAGGLYATSI